MLVLPSILKFLPRPCCRYLQAGVTPLERAFVISNYHDNKYNTYTAEVLLDAGARLPAAQSQVSRERSVSLTAHDDISAVLLRHAYAEVLLDCAGHCLGRTSRTSL